MRDWIAMTRNSKSSWQCAERDYSIMLATDSTLNPVVRFWDLFVGYMPGLVHLQELHKHEAQRSENDVKIDIDQPIGNSSRFNEKTKIPETKKTENDMQSELMKKGMEMCPVMLAGGVSTAQNRAFEDGA